VAPQGKWNNTWVTKSHLHQGGQDCILRHIRDDIWTGMRIVRTSRQNERDWGKKGHKDCSALLYREWEEATLSSAEGTASAKALRFELT
jgi:hypothetical protein